jgi:hypothetical protein
MSRLLQGSSRLLQVDTSSSLLGASGIFFRDSSKVDINDNQFSTTMQNKRKPLLEVLVMEEIRTLLKRLLKNHIQSLEVKKERGNLLKRRIRKFKSVKSIPKKWRLIL